MDERNPLLNPHSIEGDVWILLPSRYTDRGVVRKRIHLSLGPGKPTIVHVFKLTEAICHPNFGQTYIFRVTLNAEEMSNCSIDIWGDDLVTDDKASWPINRKLLHVPPNKEDEFWNNFHFEYRQLQNRLDGEACFICLVFNTKLVKMSSIDQLFESDTSDTMESVINIGEGLDFSPFRLPLQSAGSASDSFAQALEDVRETFVTSSIFSRTNVKLHEELKRNFDLKFLKLSNLKAKHEPYFIVYDEREKTLQFVERDLEDIQHLSKKDFTRISNTIRQIYDQSLGTRTTNKGFQEAVRHNWIKYQCLQGQDDEFNIFRSLCFAPPSNLDQRYHIGFVALCLQILLCIGITMDSVEQWSDTSLENVWDTIISLEYEIEYMMIVAISMLTFVFILQRLRKTINSFKRFYRNIHEVCEVPKAIIALDFTSNVVVGTYMAMITPFFLLQSEDIQTVVLNSFALTIFIALDDLANVFESDEADLLQEDAYGMERMRTDLQWLKRNMYSSGVAKREIGREWTGSKRLQMLAKFLFSPFYESFLILKSLIDMCCRGKCRNHKHLEPLEQKEIPQRQVKCSCGEVFQVLSVTDNCFDPFDVIYCDDCKGVMVRRMNPDRLLYHCGCVEARGRNLCEDCAERKFIMDL